MRTFRVHLARTTWLTVNVEADDEDQALEQAYDIAPVFSAAESGWGSYGQWSADAEEWMSLEDFYNAYGGEYNPERDGETVEELP